MRIFRLAAMFAMALAFGTVPVTGVAQQQTNTTTQPAKPTPDQVKSAVKQALMSVGLTMPQKRQIRQMVQSYDQQTANADDATKQAAQKTLLQNIYGQLTPTQQTQFKASIKQSLGVDMQQP